MTIPPVDQDAPQLWMTVSDVFHIKGRGCVVTGRLEGNFRLSVGDALIGDDGQRWQIGMIEARGATLTAAEPGMDIGALLKGGPAGDELRGKTVQFELGSASGLKKKRWRN
jgi:translation elongation factor EF-Tu-like GTPase